jgi:ribosome-binding protein aMBF1 (putative translation factor)
LEFGDWDLKAAGVNAASLQHDAVITTNIKLPLNESARKCFARFLRELRVARGLAQEGLAFDAGVHRTFVAHVERGARNSSIDNIERLAIALGVRSADLLRDLVERIAAKSKCLPWSDS